ncbi:hypothetical protein HGM15179_003166 [Zosterops borbonicus]|uniref:Uncharacterized protein n=1 Tax=Zosterops borbonicus TaxID=364589 RepID=A0A8K1GUL9_9PASS|nr:hypothetical protein HGM15179_003166 [Zosterops borbonicus]
MSSAVTGKDAVVQTKFPQKQKAVQVSGGRECQRLALELDDSSDNSCVKCEQADDLFIMVAVLREEVERLRRIRDPEEEIGWWSHSIPFLWQMHQPAAAQEAEDPPSSHHIRQKKGTSEMGGRNGNRSLLKTAEALEPVTETPREILAKDHSSIHSDVVEKGPES